MAAPRLDIELDPGPWNDPQWAEFRAAGDSVSGRVLLFVDDLISCRRLLVSVGWHTEGRGDRAEGTCGEETLLEGELHPGEHTFPFSFRLPAGPISYAGHYVNIVWQVAARLDLAWKRDPKAERRFQLTLP